MDATSELSSDHPALVRQGGALAPALPLARRMADAIRALAIDAAEQPGTGNTSLSMGMADVAAALWTRFHKFDAADPSWPDRDRFVVSAGHGSMLLYPLLYLTGHDGMSIDDIRNVRKSRSPATGHSEYGEHPAIETTTGPLGQGLATAVGMAIAERNMAARFGKSLVDHRTWVIACDGDMMEGISHEAAALAGHLGLSKLTVMYHDSREAIGGDPAQSCSDDVLKRFSAYGWAAKQVDGHDPAQINGALSFAMRSKKPTLIACRTAPGFSVPVRAGATGEKERLDRDPPPFVTPADLKARWHAAGIRGAAARRSWLKRLARHNQRGEFERVTAGRLPDNWHEAVAALKQDIAGSRPFVSSRATSQKCLEALLPATAELIGGSAGPAGLNLAQVNGMAAISAGNYAGRCIDFGLREHGMAAAANGMALHGGIIPYVGTLFAFSEHLRPALCLSATMRQRVIYVLTHDSIEPGEDGPTHRAVEHLASLRAMPNLHVFRPADALETVECWELAIRRSDGPSLLALSRQALPPWRTDATENRCARGGYVLAEADGPRRATIIASGSEVAIAMAARERLAGDTIAAAVVSLPCWELFALQHREYRAEVLGGAPRVGIEAAGGFGWAEWLGQDGMFIGMTGIETRASHQDLYAHFGLTPEAVVAAVMRQLE